MHSETCSIELMIGSLPVRDIAGPSEPYSNQGRILKKDLT